MTEADRRSQRSGLLEKQAALLPLLQCVMGENKGEQQLNQWREGKRLLRTSVPGWYVGICFILAYGIQTATGDISDLADYTTKVLTGSGDYFLPSMREVLVRGLRYFIALGIALFVAFKIRKELRRP